MTELFQIILWLIAGSIALFYGRKLLWYMAQRPRSALALPRRQRPQFHPVQQAPTLAIVSQPLPAASQPMIPARDCQQIVNAAYERMEEMRQVGARQEASLFEMMGLFEQAQAEIGELRRQLGLSQQEINALKAAQLPFIPVEAIAQATTFLIVGSRGSGKTELLKAILRTGRKRYVIDPHSAQGKWPNSVVVGGGRNFVQIRKFLAWVYLALNQRSQEQAQKREGECAFPPMLLVSDEWRAVIQEARHLKKSPRERALGALTLTLLTEGRKYGIGFGAVTHNDTLEATLGIKGEAKTFLNSFDWIVYTGAFVADKIAARYPEVFTAIPWIEVVTDAGRIKMPLHAVAYQPATRQYAMIDLRAIPVAQVSAEAQPVLPAQATLRLGEAGQQDLLLPDAPHNTPDAAARLAPMARAATMEDAVLALPEPRVAPIVIAATFEEMDTEKKIGTFDDQTQQAILLAAHQEIERGRSAGKKPSISEVCRQSNIRTSGQARQQLVQVLKDAELYEHFEKKT